MCLSLPSLLVSQFITYIYVLFNNVYFTWLSTEEILSISISIPGVVVNQVKEYLLIVMFTGISFAFYMGMLYIILDRLLSIVLHMRYRVYCTSTSIKCVLITTWFVGGVMILTVSVARYKFNFDWETIFYIYFYPTLAFAIILVTFVTYSFIFSKYKKSYITHRTRRSIQSGQSKKTTVSSFTLFRKSKFYIPALLVGTFIVFMVVPDLVMLFYGVLGNNMSDTLFDVCMLSYAVSNIADGSIYIFMQPAVISLLKTVVLKFFNPVTRRSKRRWDIPRRDIFAVTPRTDGHNVKTDNGCNQYNTENTPRSDGHNVKTDNGCNQSNTDNTSAVPVETTSTL